MRANTNSFFNEIKYKLINKQYLNCKFSQQTTSFSLAYSYQSKSSAGSVSFKFSLINVWFCPVKTYNEACSLQWTDMSEIQSSAEYSFTTKPVYIY